MAKPRHVPELTPAELLEVRDRRDPLSALQHTNEVFAAEYADHRAVTATDEYYGPGIWTGLTWGHLRALQSELEMYRRHEAEG